VQGAAFRLDDPRAGPLHDALTALATAEPRPRILEPGDEGLVRLVVFLLESAANASSADTVLKVFFRGAARRTVDAARTEPTHLLNMNFLNGNRTDQTAGQLPGPLPAPATRRSQSGRKARISSICAHIEKRERRDSNPRPPA
jgi:hypothetical protein